MRRVLVVVVVDGATRDEEGCGAWVGRLRLGHADASGRLWDDSVFLYYTGLWLWGCSGL